MAVISGVRAVAGRLDVGDEDGVAEALGEGGALGNRGEEEFADRSLAAFHIVRPDHGADAGCAVGQGDEPKPAVIEPINRDIAFALTAFAAGTGEMRVQRGAIVFLVALFGLQPRAEKGVTARRVDEEVRGPRLA